MRIVTVAGTRPQLIKLAALQPALRARHDEVLVDTGQHYDDALAGNFFGELGLAQPDHTLGVGGGSGTDQTARMLLGLEPVLAQERPDAVLVLGDTNSTLAGSLAAAKAGVPVAHVEAGLRSFDRAMPEEINRVVADHLSRWNFAPTPTAVANLAAEGIHDGVRLVGDVMQDLVARMVDEVRDPSCAPLPTGCYLFATIHRAENRQPAHIRRWVALLNSLTSRDRPILLALHPGTRAALEAVDVTLDPTIRVVDPLGYRSSLAAQLHAGAVLTDSGGVQREASWLGVPCLILRDRTEWLETLDDSGGRTAVIGLDEARGREAVERWVPAGRPSPAAGRAATATVAPSGAAEAIASALAEDAT